MSIVGLDKIEANMEAYVAEQRKKVTAVMEYEMAEAEVDMKREAPWHDRTGNARRNLRGTATTEPEVDTGFMVHGMEYGKFLELCHYGKYRIVVPIWLQVQKGILSKLKEVW